MAWNGQNCFFLGHGYVKCKSCHYLICEKGWILCGLSLSQCPFRHPHRFSTLSGYWPVEIEDTDHPKTAFWKSVSIQSNVIWVLLTFRTTVWSCNISAPNRGCSIWPSEVPRTPGQSAGCATRWCLPEAGLKLKPSKCSSFQHKILHLGHVIGRSGVAPDP